MQLTDASSDLSEDLLPEGTLTQPSGNPILNLGPYSNTITHTQLGETNVNILRTSMTSSTFEYGTDWNDANPGHLVMASASEKGTIIRVYKY